MPTKWIILGAIFCALPSYAGPRTAGSLTTGLKDGAFTATLKDGFHFNEKAPNSATVDGTVIKPTKLSSREARFEGVAKEFSEGRAALFICDDAVTFCETTFIDLKSNTEIMPAAAIEKPVKKGKKGKAEKAADGKGKVNKHGFIEDDFNLALSEAKKDNKLLLVDFSARWCPGCVRFELETFPTAGFQKMAQDFVKLKIDVDRFENSVLSEKFVIKGIPTLLVLTADQEEVDRIVDFQPMEILTQFFTSVQADPVSLRELSEKARSKSPEILLRYGKRLLAAGRSGEALEALKKIQPPPPELLQAQVKTYPKDIKVLKAAIQAEPGSTRSIAWRASLVELISRFDEKMKIRNEGVSLADELLANPEKLKEAVKTDLAGEFTDFEAFMVAMLRAELIESADGTAREVDAAWKKAAQVGTSLKIPSRNIGASMRHLIVLTRAKEFQQADRLALRLLQIDPKNPELQRRRLRLLVELKNFDGAIKLGKQVIGNSYGRNEFWAAEVVAKAYAQTNRKKEAREFIDSYLARTEMDWPNMKETRKTFEELKTKIPNG